MANSDCELFACERRYHVRHVLQPINEEPKEITISVGKRRKALDISENDEVPSKKKAREKIIRKLDEKKERVKKSLQDVTASNIIDSPTTAASGRRSSGRARNMPAKYKDFAHDLVIKKEPEDNSVEVSGVVQPEQSTSHAKLNTITETEVPEPEMPVAEMEAEVTKSGHEDTRIESDDEEARVELGLNSTAALKKIKELVNITQNLDVEKRTENRVETRTSGSVKVKYEPVDVKNEPDALIKEIFKSEVKKPNIFTKEQKEELAEKYKQYYRIFDKNIDKNIKKEKGEVNEGENKSQENDSQLEKEKESENIEKGENEGYKEEESGDGNKEKENQTNTIKAVIKKYVISKDTSKPVVATESGAAGPGRKAQWRYHCPVCTYTTPHVGFFEHHMTRVSRTWGHQGIPVVPK